MRAALVLALFISLPALAQTELGLDLTPGSAVKPVVLIPPLFKQTSSEGAFAGFSAAKVTEKLDLVTHRRLVLALEKALGGGKVISTEATTAALASQNIKLPALRTTQGMAQLAKATGAAWVIFYSLEKGTLTGAIYTLLGETTGKTSLISNVAIASVTPAQAEAIQTPLAKSLVELSKPKPEEVVVAPPPEEDVSGEVENEIAREHEANKSVIESVDNTRPRITVAVGAGVALRNQLIGGAYAPDLAAIQNNAALSVAFSLQVNPLDFFGRFRDKPYDDLFVDFTYRRAFVHARGVSGGVEGQACSVVDDDLQVRGNFRWKLGGMLPSIGVGAGWAQERSAYTACELPVVSAIYRGVDLQLRVRQPLFRDLVALDIAWGPRVLVKGPTALKTGFSWAGEAWIEAKPYSVLFIRGGGRMFRAVVSDNIGVVTADARAFFGLEAGAHF